ncbi:oxidoreductase [Aliidongia dinghuensis]|uniref:Oxidoreductase n=1 Tax=Aliidongia dinghuensis TaxID=1867774 RepID=A0A8J2YPX3_9PROT|nr:zinc-binding alcohol dehydrogenase family protein [Aliidongia dinghuensis]GGF04670.1 oxidoreductase [Aliidongia dinghuensis]
MRAIQFTEFGDPSKLQLATLLDPQPDEATAVIRIKAASVNPSDVKNVAGQMEHTVLPRVPGRDFSGIVEHGPAEWLGAEVWGTGGDIGFLEDGTHAERIAFPIASLVRKPTNLDHATASAIGVNFVIAWLGTVTYAGLAAGETIAVVGAGGGVGGAVVQIAKARGCRVMAIDRRPPSPESPAGRLIDDYVPADADVPAEVRRLTGGTGASVVFDAVGGVMFEPALLSLAHRGRLVEISGTGKRRVEFDVIDFYHNESRIFGADSRKLDTSASAALLADLVPGFESGAYSPPVIAATYPLEEARAAYEAVAKGTAGRVVLTP